MNLEWNRLAEAARQIGRRTLLVRTFRLPNDHVGEFEVLQQPDVVCILPLTAEGRVVLTRQYRPGPERVLLELPGGVMETGETPLEAAARELLEETGCTGELHHLSSGVGGPYTTLRRHHFVATGCQRISAQHLDETEFIEVVELPLNELRQRLRAGELWNTDTIYMGLDYLNLL